MKIALLFTIALTGAALTAIPPQSLRAQGGPPTADAPQQPASARSDPANASLRPQGGARQPTLVKQPVPRNAWGKPNFNGVWSHDIFSRGDKVFYALPAFGGLPDISMMQPWVQKIYRQNYENMNSGKQVLNNSMRCLPAGTPNILMEAHSLQMVLTPTELIFLAQTDHQVRIVPIGDALKHAAVVKPTWTGDAIAHWDGDTLVIDTVGLTARSELDPMGTPHTAQLHVSERLSYDEFGRVVIETTLTDPGALVRPWTYQYHYAKGGREAQSENVDEFACAENNRDGVITPDK